MSDVQIFCDFDGTITKEDTLNKFLRTYADKKWLELEDDWLDGKIGSRECTFEQMKLVPELSDDEMKDFIDSIQIDERFVEFISYVKEKNIDFYIVSDGFDYFINTILECNNISGITVFSNHLEVKDRKYICEFPYTSSKCNIKAGMCKCNIVKKYAEKKPPLMYIGDGFSDFCVSHKADILFAKGKLLEYCKNNKNNKRNLIGFRDFKEILDFLKCSKGDEHARYEV